MRSRSNRYEKLQESWHGGNTSLHDSLTHVGPLDPDLIALSDSQAAKLKLLTGQFAADFHFVLNDDTGRPYVYIDRDSCRYVYDDKLPDVDSSNMTVLSYTSFKKIEAVVGEMNINDGHYAESLKGKQKYCILCKQVGRKTNDGLIGVRTRTKCSSCDLPLCKGFPRNCFKIIHELFKLLKYPNLRWSLHHY